MTLAFVRGWLAIGVSLSMATDPAVAVTDDPALRPDVLSAGEQEIIQKAIEHFIEGQRLFNAREYVAAAHEFERSYAAIPIGSTLYNIALSYERGGLPVLALEAALRYLALPDCEDPDRCAVKRGEVARTVERLRRAVGELSLVVEPGVEIREVRVGGVVVPLDDFPLVREPGPIEVEVFGFRDGEIMSRVARLVAGDTIALHVTPFALRPVLPDDVRAVDLALKPDPGSRLRLRRGVFAMTGLTAASAVATGVVGGVALWTKHGFERRLCGDACVYDEMQSLTPYPAAWEQRYERMRLVTNVMLGVTAGLAITTGILGLVAYAGRGTTSRRASLTKRRSGPRLGVAAGSLELHF